MFTHVNRRITAGMMAVAIVLTQVLLPVQQAFAAENVGAPLRISKVDENGNLLPGATFEGEHCTKYDDEPEWTCVALSSWSWFRDELTNKGTTDCFTTSIDAEYNDAATSCANTRQVVEISELSAPQGYAHIDGTSVICRVGNGWVADGQAIPGYSNGVKGSLQSNVTMTANSITFHNGRTIAAPRGPLQIEVCGENNDQIVFPSIDENLISMSDTGWQTYEYEGQPYSSRAVIYKLKNAYNRFDDGQTEVEYYFSDSNRSCDTPKHQSELTFEKVDGNGNLLPGTTFEGESCTKWGSSWACQKLSDYSWFRDGLTIYGSTGDRFSSEIAIYDTNATTCAESTHVVSIRETGAPEGYQRINGTSAFCLTKDGWLADGSTDGVFTFSLADGVKNDGHTVTFVNQLIPSPKFVDATCSDAQNMVMLPALMSDYRWTYQVNGGARTDVPRKLYGTNIDLATLGAKPGDTVEVSIIYSDGTVVAQTAHNLKALSCTPGKGGIDPAAPTAPAVNAASASTILPAPSQLPQAGPSDSTGWSGLLIAVVAAIATYGAVYFAQPKRQYE